MGQTHRSNGFAYGTCDRCGDRFKRVARGQPYKYCSRECSVEPVMDRVMRRLKGSDEPGGCLVWTGKCHDDGYGEIQHEGRVWKVHRLVWEMFVGAIPEGMCVCHKCDNPRCARPDHLFLGTHEDNMRDMAAKGRGVYPDCRGERHGAAKLTDDDVRAIRADKRSQSQIAADYGIAQSLVSKVKRRLNWGHVPDDPRKAA